MLGFIRQPVLHKAPCCVPFLCQTKNKNMIEYLRENLLHKVQEEVDTLGVGGLKGKLSDGYHTFDELYEFRKVYNAVLFNEWAKQNNQYTDLPIYDVHKSWNHYDGQPCFGGGWFIVVATLPTGQISNHYEAKDWDLFKIPEAKKAKHPFDGHTSADVLKRLSAL